ncbi:unnamed protein product [Blepharisma stoltei]|uniref:Uncharacterized protein n=1 Tax=Blepharisma stoltei TaxID=1481888 RepID=A0AAU9IWG5_9CILI|nr:unnamed protein product [Blepharisma stoltei]
MTDTSEESCSFENCINPSEAQCICLIQPKSYCRTHLFKHLEKFDLDHKTQRIANYDQKIWREKAEEINKISTDLMNYKESFKQKIESLLKTDEFYAKIENNLEIARQLTEFLTVNCSKNSLGVAFETKFGQSYEKSLNALKEEILIISKTVDDIKDIFLIKSDDFWKSKVYKEIDNSDYKALCNEITPLNIDYLYSQTILKFFDEIKNFKDSEANLFDNLKDHYFNKTNFCDKEIILSNLADKLSEENQKLLYNIVCLSRKNNSIIQSASNAFSILVKSNYPFTFANFSNVKIPYANLSGKAFYRTNFGNADLSYCNVSKSQLLNCFVNCLNLTGVTQSVSSEQLVIYCVSFSHNENWIAASQLHKILLYASDSPKNPKELSHRDISCAAKSISWSFDDNYLVSGHYEGHMFIWDLLNKENPLLIRLDKYHNEEILSVSWSPIDYRIASGSASQDIKIWDKETSQILYQRYKQGYWILELLWSQTAKYICYRLGNGGIKIIDIENKETLNMHLGSEICGIDWIFYDNYIAFGALKSIKIWDYKTNTICNTSKIEFSSIIKCIKWLADWYLIAAGLENGTIVICSVEENEERNAEFEISFLFKFRGHGSDVRSLTWSCKGSLLASGSHDGTAKIWKIKRNFEEDLNSEATRSLTLITKYENSDNSTIEEAYLQDRPNSVFEEFLWSSEPNIFINLSP